jgi:V/A-type H+-transporting ATPase subunit F
MKYSIIGDEDAVLSFGIVGVSGRTATNPDEAITAFQETLEDKEIGIILVTESVADMMRSTVEKYVFTVNFPLIVEIPTGKVRSPADQESKRW